MQEVKKGWNEWAGEGVSDKRHQEKVNKAEAIKRKRIEDLKKQRSDHRMKGVVVNSEDRDKKFAHKYLIKELPHNYGTVDQYQKIMNAAVGKEWTTLQSHKRLIQPEVLTKAGEIIKPLSFKKEISGQTLESLVAHRQNKREKRPAAKF